MPRGRGHFADVDFRVEVGGEMLAVIAAVAIENVERADCPQLVLLQPHRENAGHTRIEARAEQRHDPRIPEADRKSAVEGKSVSVRVELGGRRRIKKKKKKKR